VTGAKDLVAGNDHACMLIEKDIGGVVNDNIDCWGDLNAATNTVNYFASHLPVLLIAAARSTTCAVSVSGGLFCDGLDDVSFTVPFANLPANANQLEITADVVCARSDSAIRCWNSSGVLLDDVPENLTSVSDLALGGQYRCTINNGRPQCWGQTGVP
jgi:hypothetical protein